MTVEKNIEEIKEEIKDKWIEVSKEHKKMSVAKKIQKIIEIPLEDIKNIMVQY